MRSARRRGADVDITPLIDMMFMLVIFFVLTAVFVRGTIDIDLPRGDAEPMTQRNPIVVTVTMESALLWAGEPITRGDLPELVADALNRGEEILIAGDRRAPYGSVASVLDELRGLGVKSVSLAFEGGSAFE
ncbi:MAG: biopolymer transporter ExbD [Synergistaceae bacterium]|jgi:biopolymer transport protein ExbD|nr:biopolymer transporter ExbD [Synergistaceae bacterium]